MTLTRITAPEGVHPSDGYAHAVTGPGRVVALAGHMPFAPDGAFVGAGDPAAQARQIFENLRGTLAAAGATFANLVRLNYYLTDIGHVPAVLAVRDEYIAKEELPASTVVQVAALYRPDLLMEIDALAILPE
jgi:enamine deaminase RidA (YjgF/YER057c/UK114 family)